MPRTYTDGEVTITNPFFQKDRNVILISTNYPNWYYYDDGEAKQMAAPSNWNIIGNKLVEDLASIFTEQTFEFNAGAGRLPTEPYKNCLDY